ncbi:hypothetical protein LTR78_006280 [Recurvomyces mirabilis]|uniref:Uncharacterized protein n=1 Tax=Recurvomyces mirabilis TaxID=574656 RepID=A0AAE0WL46_9PEZI|nr:hypothetical protein LTR78_006280 [Recurvomyces mirabilis]KAK5152169.1 hypothetical protein LTS14_008544 [Recurvomyces mirabilis]
MTGGEGDTHDHGPPRNTTPTRTTQIINQSTPYPQLAIWSTRLSSAGVNSFSGAVAGVASGIVTCPLDVIKTKLQAGRNAYSHPGQADPKTGQTYRGMRGTAATIIKQDGVLGLYRGLGPMLLGYLPTWAVYMAVYDSSREYFYKNGYGEHNTDKWLARVYASVTAGACSTLATNPIWVIKTRLMSQVSTIGTDGARSNSWNYNSTLDAARKMYRAEGLRAFYSGLTPAMLGLTHVAIQFPLYEYFKQQFTGLEMGESPAAAGSEGRNTVGILAATFLSKVCATTATYPHEVIRTRLQTQRRNLHPESTGSHSLSNAHHHAQSLPKTGKLVGSTDGMAYQPQYKGVITTCKTILKEEGGKAFYSGLGTNLIRAVPAAMTTMLTFESIKGAIGRLQETGQEMERDGLR